MLFLACNNTSKKTETEQTFVEPVSKSLTEKDISKLKYVEYVLDIKTENAIKDWLKYKDLEDLVQNVKKGDLSYFNDNKKAIKTFLEEFMKTVPDTVNTPSVTARITALETKLYKLESLSNLETTTKQELGETIKEFLQAYSNLNFQMNKKLEKDSNQVEKP
jgi:cysteinyl-tRNA synthetase